MVSGVISFLFCVDSLYFYGKILDIWNILVLKDIERQSFPSTTFIEFTLNVSLAVFCFYGIFQFFCFVIIFNINNLDSHLLGSTVSDLSTFSLRSYFVFRLIDNTISIHFPYVSCWLSRCNGFFNDFFFSMLICFFFCDLRKRFLVNVILGFILFYCFL